MAAVSSSVSWRGRFVGRKVEVEGPVKAVE